MILVLVLYMLFASTFTLAKGAVNYIPPVLFIGVRMTIAGCLLLLFRAMHHKRMSFNWADWPLFIQLMLFHVFGAYVLEFWALQYVTSVKTALIFSLSPFITAVFSRYLFDERLKMTQKIGLLIGFAALIPMLIGHTSFESTEFIGISLPEIALIGAVICSAYGWIVFKIVMHRSYAPMEANGVGMLGGGVLALLFSFLIEGRPTMSLELCATESRFFCIAGDYAGLFALLTYTVLLILIANVIAYNLYGSLLNRYSPTFLSFAGFTTPLFAGLFGKIWLGESLPEYFFIAVILVAVGLYLFDRQTIDRTLIKKI